MSQSQIGKVAPTANNVFLTVDEAREVFQEQHLNHLVHLPQDVKDMLTPEFPAGTREYARYEERLKHALAEPGAWDFLDKL